MVNRGCAEGREGALKNTVNKRGEYWKYFWGKLHVHSVWYLCVYRLALRPCRLIFGGPAGPQSDWPPNRCYYTSMRPLIWSLTPHCVTTPCVCVCVCVFVRPPLRASFQLSPSFQTLLFLLYSDERIDFSLNHLLKASLPGGLWSAPCSCKLVVLFVKLCTERRQHTAKTVRPERNNLKHNQILLF